RRAEAPRRPAHVRGEAPAQIRRTEEIGVKPLQKTAVVAAVFATLGLPWVGSVLKFRPDPIPGFGNFPPQQIARPPGFNLLYFAAAVFVALVMVAFLLVPKWFGFKPVPVPPAPTPG